MTAPRVAKLGPLAAMRCARTGTRALSAALADGPASSCDLLVDLVDSLQQIDQLTAHVSQLLERAHHTGEAEAATGVSTELCLSAAGRRTRPDRRMLQAWADLRPSMPLAAAFDRGAVSWAQVRALALSCQRLPANDPDTAGERHFGGSRYAHDRWHLTRARGARRADRLVGICARALADGTAAAPAPVGPTVMLTMSLGNLIDGDGPTPDLSTRLTGGRLKVATPTAQRLVEQAGARLRTIVLDATGQILGVGRDTRIPPVGSRTPSPFATASVANPGVGPPRWSATSTMRNRGTRMPIRKPARPTSGVSQRSAARRTSARNARVGRSTGSMTAAADITTCAAASPSTPARTRDGSHSRRTGPTASARDPAMRPQASARGPTIAGSAGDLSR